MAPLLAPLAAVPIVGPMLVNLLGLAGGATTGFISFLMGKTLLLATLLKPLQAVIYVFMQAKMKSFMRKKKQLENEIYDAELDTEDLALKPSLDVFRNKSGVVTQRMKKVRRLNKDILDLWAFCKKYNVVVGGRDAADFMVSLEKERLALRELVSAYPQMLMEMRGINEHYIKEEMEIEDRLEAELMARARKFSPIGKWLRVVCYILGWWWGIDLTFDWLYSVAAPGSNLHEYMLTPYAEQILHYRATYHEPLIFLTTFIGGGLVFWKRLFMGEKIYVEFTRRLLLVLRGVSILALGVVFVMASMHYVLPLFLEGGFVYEVLLKDYPDFAHIMSNVVFGLVVLVVWFYLTYKSAKKLFWDPRKIIVSEADKLRVQEFYEYQNEICRLYTSCSALYYTLVILVEQSREEQLETFEDFDDIDALMVKVENEKSFFKDSNVHNRMEELDGILPSQYAYRQKKLTTQQDV